MQNDIFSNKFLTIEDVLKLCSIFFKYYSPVRYLATGKGRKTYLGNRKKKVCRFCGKNEHEITFKNKAHTIPQFLGNLNSFSFFECDNCNGLFNKYDTALASYLGPTRTLAYYLDPKNNLRNPVFEHKKGDLKFIRNGQNIIIEENDSFKYLNDDEEAKMLSLKYEVEYKPLDVYKALVKIAFCLFEENELYLFQRIKPFLLSSLYNDNYITANLSFLLSYFTPNEYFEFPTAFLFRKNPDNSDFEYPEFTMILFLYQLVFQIFIPFNIHDESIFKNYDDIFFPIYPPLMIEPNGIPVYNLFCDSQRIEPVNLSGQESITEKQEFFIKYAKKSKDTLNTAPDKTEEGK